MFFRTLLIVLRARRRSRLAMHDVGRVKMRVLPQDLDVQKHVNNGVYFSLMDLGRIDFLVRTGAWERMRAHGVYPVIASETISFRKSLTLWQHYDLEIRIAGFDAKAVYLEQRFVVDGEVFVRAHVRARFLKKSGGVLGIAELREILDAPNAELAPPQWLDQWARDIALPSTKAEAPSIWD